MKPMVLILVALVGLLQYQLWFAPGGVVSAYRLSRNITQQSTVNKKLSERNTELVADINDLKTGDEAIEERARNDLGMTKKGEVFYQVVK